MNRGFKFKGPGWPDLRGWAVVGFFGITFYSLSMIRENPALLANASFMQFTAALASGGILLVAANLFGGTKAAADQQARSADPAPPPPPLTPAEPGA